MNFVSNQLYLVTTTIILTQNNLSHVGVGKAGRREHGRAVVEKVVGACKLLKGLDDHAQHDAISHPRPREDFPEGWLPTIDFELELFLHFDELVLDDLVPLRHAVEPGNAGGGGVDLSVAVIVTGCLGEEDDTDAEHDGEQEANAHGNSP